ncbi:NUDIX hydrolase [Amphibiibacter pelophylacis]|uniref:NUDIX hydrolase n=1 Tax=Amphibiibacter pelophylacis TaxID=1799477 RepID=A0ACC6P4N8_9BURK
MSLAAADTPFFPHVTVAALIEQEGRFLLVEERQKGRLVLNNPAGHLDPGESLVQACVREVLEETAHDFTPTALVGVYLSRYIGDDAPAIGSPTFVRFAFCGTLGAHHPDRVLDSPITQCLWLSPDEMRQQADRLRSPSVWQGVQDYLCGRRLPLEALHTHASVYGGAGTGLPRA